MSQPSPPNSTLPSRATTGLSEDAIPEADPSTTAGLLAERLQAWKHMVGYLEDYVEAVEKVHGRQAKEYEKVLKTISNPLREGHHFDQSLGGIAGFFENMRANTQAMVNTNIETEKSIKGSVLPILDRLHKEIKHKAKELASGAQAGAKEVDKLRNVTQKHIELLGQQAAAFESHGGKMNSHDDPYVVRRGVLHRLNNQVIAENNHHNDLVAVQNNFRNFESHILEVVQQAIEGFTQLAGGQGEKMRALHSDILGTVQCIPRDFEWTNFQHRAADRLVSANDPPRSVEAIQFPNMEHASTKALIEGSLERKSRNKLSFGFSTGYGVPTGDKFTIKGKDKSGTLSSKLTGSSEITFKAHTPADAQRWFQVIQGVTNAAPPVATAAAAGGTNSSTPTSPVGTSSSPETTTLPVGQGRPAEGEAKAPVDKHQAQEAGVTGGEANPAAV
ncbi:hypothetical protein M440DRAFT_3957 [Trichoderma longibrachiatum ATCC 18648]|uniref:SLM1/RGC1-like BAR-like domain-containing protein n=1 Tax=Trichoderma longibrachiatum ATCC 18648 TaxID=983965 RepID=A0A2T4C8C5_TRILO|nr:hypothetical protein M440DRAFT_3957 [Trichoderma longibrachiatum ATCC 18648]